MQSFQLLMGSGAHHVCMSKSIKCVFNEVSWKSQVSVRSTFVRTYIHNRQYPCTLNNSLLTYPSVPYLRTQQFRTHTLIYPHSHTYVLLYSLLVHVTIPYWHTTQLVMITFKLTAPTHTLGYSLLTLNNSHSHTQLFAFPTHTLNHSSLKHSTIPHSHTLVFPILVIQQSPSVTLLGTSFNRTPLLCMPNLTSLSLTGLHYT